MFCKNCGTENEANAAFCKSCGAPMESETEQNTVTSEAEAATQIPETAPETGAAAFSEPVTETAPAPKKKKKVLPVIIAVAAIIVIALAVILIGFKDTIGIRMASAEKQQLYAFDKLATDLTDAYGDIVSAFDATGSRGSLKIELGESAKTLISQSGIDLSSVESVELTYDVNNVDNIMSVNAGLSYNSKELIGAEAVIDLDAGVLTLSIPALSDKALKLDLSEYVDISSLNISVPEIMPDTALVEKILPRYIEAALGAIKNVEKSAETFTVGDVSQKATCYTTVFNEKLFAEMVLEVIKEARQDADLKTVIFDFVNGINKLAPEDAENAQELYDELVASIDEAIEDFAEETFSEETLATLKVWADSRFGIIGVQFDIVDFGVIFAGETESGSDVAAEISVTAEGEKVFELTSKGTLKRGIYNGELAVKAEGNEIVNIKSENVDTENEDAFIGKLTVTSSALGEANPALAMLSFTIEGKKDKNTQTLILGAGLGDGALASISISTEEYAGKKAELHANTTEDADEWAMEIAQSDKFAKILEDSGLNDLISGLMFLPMGGEDSYDDEYYFDDEYDFEDSYDDYYDDTYGDEYFDYSDTEELSDEEAGYSAGELDGYIDGLSEDYKAGYGDCIDEDKADVKEYIDAYDRGYEDGYKQGVAEMAVTEEAAA